MFDAGVLADVPAASLDFNESADFDGSVASRRAVFLEFGGDLGCRLQST
jgi:hypothetical protein